MHLSPHLPPIRPIRKKKLSKLCDCKTNEKQPPKVSPSKKTREGWGNPHLRTLRKRWANPNRIHLDRTPDPTHNVDRSNWLREQILPSHTFQNGDKINESLGVSLSHSIFRRRFRGQPSPCHLLRRHHDWRLGIFCRRLRRPIHL